jgi:hypothetical protein
MYAEGCAEQKDWAAAAKAYEDSWKGDKKPLALFLSGVAMVRAGQEAEGKQAMLRARTMMLADDSLLRPFEEALKKRPWTGAAEEEDEFLMHTATDVWALASALTGKAERAAKRGDFAAAAAAMERINQYNCLADRGAGPQAWYIFREHIYRAREMAKTGKFAEMMSELKIAMAMNDHGSSEIGELVLSLEKAGHKAEADQVYAAAKKSGEEYLKERPADITRLNNVAWLMAYCRRDLDQGLAYAQRGMEGDSELPYLADTLAEILFQRGETQKAIDLATRCCAMNGLHKYYFRQLARFRAADKTAPIPDEDW